MDKLQWFKFTPSDWMMGKIQRCDEITQARFIRLCCLYWNKECNLSIEDGIIEIDQQYFDILVSKKIISKNQTHFNISFLDEQFLEVSEISTTKSQSGIIGNLKRWHRNIYNEFIEKKISLEEAVIKSKNIAEQSQTDSEPITDQSQIIADKKREEEIILEKKRKEKNINDRKLKFACTLEPFLNTYGKEFLNDFYKYWTEPNKSNTKFKQELEKTWSLERRLETWAKNDKNFKEKSSAKKESEPIVAGRQTMSTIIQNMDMTGIINPHAVQPNE